MSEAALSSSDAYHGTRRKPPKQATAQLLKFIDSTNIADDLSDEELNRIGERVCREYTVDKESRRDWETRMGEAMNLALQITEEKNYPWPKAANIKFPLLTTAAIQFAARAYPAIIQGRDVVKGMVVGPDEGVAAQQAPTAPGAGMGSPLPQSGVSAPAPLGQPMAPLEAGPMQPGGMEGGQPQPQPQEQQWEVKPGAKRERANRIGRHMSWQLLDEMEEWEEDTDQLLVILPIVGFVARKTWFDPSLGRNRSELVTADNLVFNYVGKFDRVPRHTQVFKLYPHEIEERFRMGLYRKFELGTTGDPNDDQSPHEFYEQHRWDDLDEDGYPEPYIVTVHKDTSKVARIVARFDQEGVKLSAKNEVLKIEPVKYYTPFLFMPSPDGGNLGIGFGALLRPMNEAINTTVNQMLDAGHLQNTGGGFIGYGLKIKGGNSSFRPGEYKRVEQVAGGIRDNIVPLEFPGPSAVLFNLLGLLIEAGRDISSVKDVMTGGTGPSNEAASRTLARIEQGMKVFSAIHKRVFRSLKQEYQKLARLNRLYLPQQQYFTFQDDPEAIAREDYEDADLDVAPAADPNMVTDVQKMAQAEFLMQFRDDPSINQIENNKRILSAVGVADLDQLVLEEPPPNPEIALEADKIDIEKKKLEIEVMRAETEGEKIIAEVAKIKSEIILNLAKAEAESDKAEIAGLGLLLDSILNQHKLRIDAAKADDTRQLGEKKIDATERSDERRIREMARKSNNGSGSGASS
jgi:chaperonin GroES